MARQPRPDDAFDGPAYEVSYPRGPRGQNQLDFELDFFAKLIDRDPFNVGWLRAHADNLGAKDRFDQALLIDQRLIQLQPENPIHWYNLACDRSRLDQIDDALEALERALVLGYRRLGRVCRDPDLRSLRRDPRFLRLIRRF